MRNRNFKIAVFGAAYAMAILMVPSKITVHAAGAEFVPGEAVSEAVTINNYYEQTLNDIAAEVFDTYTSSAEKRNVQETVDAAITEKYKNIGIANVEDYLNIREEANENAEIVGTLAKNAGCTIGEIDKNGWAKITSGNVTGYVLSQYLITGEEVPSLVEEVGTKVATIATETVRFRETKGTDSIVLDLLSIDQKVKVLNDSDSEWIKVKYEGQKGYVASEFVTVDYELETAKPVVKEEVVVSEAPASNSTSSSSSNSSNSSNKTSNKTSSSNSTSSSKKPASSSSSSNKSETTSSSTSTSSLRSNMVSYAKRFLGGKYVYGGTSLTSGVDCSGFTMRIYEKFGYSITRTSRTQASAGKSISVSSVKPGDLVFYSSGGSINHVAMYIGNGQVIHASNPETGIKISNMYYRTPCKAVRFIND